MLTATGTAQAHPLGNFTVNHYNGIELRPDGIDVLAVVDTAEIPTQQEQGAIDANSDSRLSDEELAASADQQCAELANAVIATVGSRPVDWTIGSRTLTTVPGAADLPTLRLTCQLSGDADLSGPATVTFTDEYRSERIGWHEITATGTGVRLLDPTVPSTTVSDELRSYPNDLLASPLDIRSATLRTEPGEGFTGTAVDIRTGYADPFSTFVAAADQRLQSLIGPDMTALVGVLAVALAVLLGCGHALLPGHGKTVMAAHLAGRRGSRRDAVIVGATVTATHTAGVLVLGVLITLGSAIIGEQALRWLGVTSGLLVAAIGLGLLRSAWQARRRTISTYDNMEVLVGTGRRGPLHQAESARPDDAHLSHVDGHTHTDEHRHAHNGRMHSHLLGGHQEAGRAGLVGMGIAGGLVPSPSALVVLLGSIALGRTIFGVLLVLAYGLGMAGTLTAVGLLLVRLRGRLDRRGAAGRLRRRVAWIPAAMPLLTAALVLLVGLALATRGVLSSV